ncbi:ABC transporter permease [Bosea sp. BIWAKO-01]|uniref:ABC transporter permease n=1 Tax=Bosea sp. BIWAKO-01 TaxID=506668 RepID=UPI0008534461|nr:ABC transporter permease [Bosea sp. BIWAKO-01]GAU86780.1 spermidine putrescine ABC transporter permease component potC [Bosea sp. BIWAKO-01]
MKGTLWDTCGRTLLPLYFLLILAYLVVPLLIVVPLSFSDTTYLVFPPRGFSWRWYAEIFSNPAWLRAFQKSLLLGVLTAIFATALGTLAAMAIVRLQRGAAFVVSTMFLVPQIVPAVITALGAFLLLNASGLYGTFAGLLIMHVMMALPLVIITMTAALRQLGEGLNLAARVLGATPAKAFAYVTFPAVAPSIAVGAVFAFFISFDELVVTLFISGSHATMPVRIWADVKQELTPVVPAAATLLTVIVAVLAIPIEIYRQRTKAK